MFQAGGDALELNSTLGRSMFIDDEEPLAGGWEFGGAPSLLRNLLRCRGIKGADPIDDAREICEEEEDLRGYNVGGTSEEQARNHVVRMNMELRRHGDDYVGFCRFENSHADLDIDRD